MRGIVAVQLTLRPHLHFRKAFVRACKPVLASVVLCLCIGVAAIPASAQWSNGYNYRRTITVNYTEVSTSNQTNFPVLISSPFSDMVLTAYGGNVVNPNGYDIIFTSDADGTSPLAFEQESYDSSTGAILYWVRIPTLSHTANTVFYMFYGNSTVNTSQSTPTAVWGSTYQGVWHLNGGLDGLTWNDSTSNANNGAGIYAGEVAPGAGEISGGASLGSGTYIDLGTSATLQPSGAMTASAWINASTAEEYSQIISDASNGTSGYNLYLANYHYPAFILDVGGWNSCYALSSTSLTDGNWHYVVGTYSGPGGTVKIYIDGSLSATSGACSNTSTTYGSPSDGEIGWKAGNASTTYFTGTLDEARITGSALSAGWIATEYNNQHSPSTFYSVSSASQSGSGSSPTITDWSPTSGPVATTVTITGTNFGSTPGTSTVTFNGATATPSSWSATSITVPVPSGATTGNIVVTVGGTPSDGVNFTVVSAQWSNNYSHRRTITINYSQVSTSDQANFPVLFGCSSSTCSDLATISNGGYVTSSNGYDIIFTSDAAGTIPLPFEQDTYSASTGAVNYWVQIPTLSHTVNTVIYMFYGNPTITTDQSDKTAVWQYTYQGVWHLGSGSSVNAHDSTISGNDGAGNTVTATTGKIGGGISLDGSSQYVDLGTAAGGGYALILPGAMTASAWIKAATSQVEFPMIVANGDSNGTTGFNLYIANYYYPGFVVGVGSWGSCFADSTTSIDDNSWHYVVGTYTGGGGAIDLYVDGVLKGSTTCAYQSTSYGSSTPEAEIGRKLNTSETDVYFNGVLDEVRIAGSALSASWIATEYNNQSSPSTFYSVGSATASSLPSITSLSPSSGSVGTEVAIAGTGFGEAQDTSTVTFNGTMATPTAWSATSITVPVPAGASSGNVVVTTTSGSSSGVSFSVTANPVILTLSPNGGPVSTSVTISGTDFGSSGTVTFNGTTATTSAWTSSSITATVPSGASTGNVVVTVSSVASNGVGFTLTSGPAISGLYPISGDVGDSVTITGTDFGSTGTVTFNGTAATTSSWTSTSITAAVPSGATTGNVVVTVSSVASNGVGFTVGQAIYYYFSDALGTNRVITNSAGTVCYDGDNDPYGTVMAYTDTCDSAYKLTGKERDPESNLDNYGARFYSSQYGRFMTPDWSAGPEIVPYADFTDPQTLNLYSYARDNPLRFVDADGHDPDQACIDFKDPNDEGGPTDPSLLCPAGNPLSQLGPPPPPTLYQQITVTAMVNTVSTFDALINGPLEAGLRAVGRAADAVANWWNQTNAGCVGSMMSSWGGTGTMGGAYVGAVAGGGPGDVATIPAFSLVGGAGGAAAGGVAGMISCKSGSGGSGSGGGGSNAKAARKLSTSEADAAARKGGYQGAEDLKKAFVGEHGSQYDLYKQPNGDVEIFGKGGVGEGIETGININK
jgi:RHS repeat-associated protein